MDAATPGLALAIIIGGLAGFGIGLFYLVLLRRSVDGYMSAAPVWGPLLWTVLRLGVAVGAFWLLVLWSAAAAIAGLIGFTLANVTLRSSLGAG